MTGTSLLRAGRTRWFWALVARCARRLAMTLEDVEDHTITLRGRVQDLHYAAADRVKQMDPDYDPEIPF